MSLIVEIGGICEKWKSKRDGGKRRRERKRGEEKREEKRREEKRREEKRREEKRIAPELDPESALFLKEIGRGRRRRREEGV